MIFGTTKLKLVLPLFHSTEPAPAANKLSEAPVQILFSPVTVSCGLAKTVMLKGDELELKPFILSVTVKV